MQEEIAIVKKGRFLFTQTKVLIININIGCLPLLGGLPNEIQPGQICIQKTALMKWINYNTRRLINIGNDFNE